MEKNLGNELHQGNHCFTLHKGGGAKQTVTAGSVNLYGAGVKNSRLQTKLDFKKTSFEKAWYKNVKDIHQQKMSITEELCKPEYKTRIRKHISYENLFSPPASGHNSGSIPTSFFRANGDQNISSSENIHQNCHSKSLSTNSPQYSLPTIANAYNKPIAHVLSSRNQNLMQERKRRGTSLPNLLPPVMTNTNNCTKHAKNWKFKLIQRQSFSDLLTTGKTWNQGNIKKKSLLKSAFLMNNKTENNKSGDLKDESKSISTSKAIDKHGPDPIIYENAKRMANQIPSNRYQNTSRRFSDLAKDMKSVISQMK